MDIYVKNCKIIDKGVYFMNKKAILSGILVCFLAFGLMFVSCNTDPGGLSDIIYTVKPSGDPTTNSLAFAFSAVVSDLTENDIIITDETGSERKGRLSGTGTNWSLGITTLTAGNISVSINKTGIESGTKTVTLIIDTGIGYSVEPGGDPTTNGLAFTFDEAVSGLTENDITISEVSGSATKGTLSGSGTSWSLGITTLTYGQVYVLISKDGIHKSARSVTLMKDGLIADIPYTITPSGDPTTDLLTFDFDTAVSGLTEDDITITNGTGSATKGTLSGSGTSWSLDITTLTYGTVSVVITKTPIESAAKTVSLMKDGLNSPVNEVDGTVWLSDPVTYSQDGLSITGKIILAFRSPNWTLDYKGSLALVYMDDDDPPITRGTYTMPESTITFIPTDATEPNPAGGDMTAAVSGSRLTLVNFGPMPTITFNKQNTGENKYAGTSWRCTYSSTTIESVGEIVTFDADLTWTRPDASAQGTYLFNGDKAQLVPKTGTFALDSCDVTATLGSGGSALTIVTSTYDLFGIIFGTDLTMTMTETFEKVTE
jgi:hypothetical protein